MLILTRRTRKTGFQNESVVVNESDGSLLSVVTAEAIKGQRVVLSFEAPADVLIYRQKIYDNPKLGGRHDSADITDKRLCTLVLTVAINENVIINDTAIITVLGVKGNQVKLGFEAPKNINIARSELLDNRVNRVAKPASHRLP